ncbi:hypothetical protein ACJMK2_018509 [Sinanodonta woodiana]|uniref:VWFD domain-containing protein n=1 Tax=Sinanodonta woodiana TaxID=1069815 RepID=A0ABD3UFP1_SINWO
MKIIWMMIFTTDLLLVAGQDCTGTYGTLPDLERRARNYVLAANEGYVSDALLDSKWYKVNQYNMPTNYTNLDVGMCGTYFPIWMNGSIPSSSDGRVTRDACIISFFDICDPAKTIEVVNCSTFMLYKLVPTVQSSGYCFDPVKTEIEPAPAPPDSATVRSELYFTSETSRLGKQFWKPRLRFWCDFQESQKDKFFYLISWYVNGVLFKQAGPERYTSRNVTNLHEDELLARNYKLGITIKCTVRASTSVNGSLGNLTASTGYWMGIQVINPNVNLQQGKTAIVQLRATFPFGCYVDSSNRDPSCFVSVQMYDPYDAYNCLSSSISVKDSIRCGVKLQGLTYTELSLGKDYTNVITNMTITTKDANDYNPGRNRFVLKLVTERGNLVNDIIGGNYLTDVNVVVQETTSWKEKVCYSYIDPHMLTFDGRKYENQNIGDFILYRHRSNKQEVQMRTIPCWSGPTCACAVAVRAGGDLFMINICSKPRLITFVSCADSILQVTQKNPNFYEVIMPLGTTVHIKIWSDIYLNIDIYPSVKDVNETLGLCGVLNNNPGDDFLLPSGLQESNNNVFSTSWRIPSSNSFFHPMNFNPTLWEEGSYLCVCPAALNTTTPPTTVSGDRLSPLCSASVYLSCTKKVINQGKPYICEVRTKRSETPRTKELERILIKQSREDDPVFNIHRLQKRETRNYTFDEALVLCTSIFDANCTTTAFEGSLPENSNTFKNDSLSNCALDIMYLGDSSLANVHCESYRSHVDEEINRNSTYREANPGVVNSFRSTACIRNCNFHGDCINGTCFCHESYIEEDCSVSLNVYPDVDDTFNGGLCKRDEEDCCGDKPIYAINLVEGITKQKSERFQRYSDGTEAVMETISSNIPVKNKYEGTMNVPCYGRKRLSTDSRNIIQTFVEGVRVSLTNDGRNYGSPQTYFTYDSRCQGVVNATNGYTFYIINGTCFINDVCYSDGNQNPSDSCKTCQSSVDPYSWTNGCPSSTKNPPSSPDLILIVASVVSAVIGLMMLVVITVVIFKCCFKKERKITGNFQVNIASACPGNTMFDGNTLNCVQTNELNEELEREREQSFHNDRLWGERPRTAKEIAVDIKEKPLT